MNLLITIPAYNEAKNIASVIRLIRKVMNPRKETYTVLVVDDGSRDATRHIALQEGAHVITHPKNYGLAEVFRTEMAYATSKKFDAIVHIDADGQYSPEEIPLLLCELDRGYDLVLGSRFRGTIESMPWLKRVGNRAFSFVISNITRKRLSDCQTGFRAFTLPVAKLPIRSNYTYTQEQIIHAIRSKFRVKEVPVYFAERKGKSRLMRHPLEYALKSGITIIRIYRDYEPLKFFGFFGLCFFLLGFLIGLYLLALFFATGIVGHLPLTLLTVLLISMGIQVILFGFLADMGRR